MVAGEEYGAAVALHADGTVAAVGAPLRDINSLANSGAVFMFKVRGKPHLLHVYLLRIMSQSNHAYSSADLYSTFVLCVSYGSYVLSYVCTCVRMCHRVTPHAQ